MNIKIYICSVLLILGGSKLEGQDAFKAGIVAGFTLAQIDGDGLLGYDKTGMSTGLKLSYPLEGNKFDVGMELLYSQRGSQSQFFGSGNLQKTHLDYIEIPVYLTLKDWYIEKEDYFKIKLHAGLSYGYLLNITSANGLYDEDINNFNTSDISFLIGPSYSISRKWTFTARFTRALTRLFKSDKFVNTDSLVSYFWTLRAEYNF